MLLDNLKQTYDIICFEDLAAFYSQNRAIFDLFKTHRKDVFLPNQRLIFYSCENPSQEFLNHIQRAAAKIDISNAFILIITPFDILSKLKEANQKYGNDASLINFEVADVKDSKPLIGPGFIKNYDSICAYPFMYLSVEQKRNAMPCCKFDGFVGNYENKSIVDIFSDLPMEKIRQSMINGEKLKECQLCWDVEKYNLTSHRIHGLSKYSDQLDQEWFDDVKLRSLDISPSQLCNFTCRICNSNASSSIAVEEIKHANTDRTNFLKKILHLNKDDFSKTIPQRVVESLNDVEFLHILGGEPFMWPQLDELLELVIGQGYAKNIELALHTNASFYPASIIDKLTKFKGVEILLSIDDIGHRFEIQRGGNWDNVYKNIKMFKAVTSSTIIVKAAITVNIQNILYLDQLTDFFQKLNIDIVWWYLEEPGFQCIDNVTQRVKDLVYQKYHMHPNIELQNIANRVMSTPAVSGQKFLEYMLKLDTRRGQDFKLYHSEIFNAMSD